MKKILLYLLPIVLIGLTAAYYMYNKPHQNMQRSAADLQMTAAELYRQFDTDESAANTQYLDKVIAVTGRVKEVITDEEGIISVHLENDGEMFGVVCQLDQLSEHQRTDFPIGETVTLKGICTGKLMDVVLVRCVEV